MPKRTKPPCSFWYVVAWHEASAVLTLKRPPSEKFTQAEPPRSTAIELGVAPFEGQLSSPIFANAPVPGL